MLTGMLQPSYLGACCGRIHYAPICTGYSVWSIIGGRANYGEARFFFCIAVQCSTYSPCTGINGHPIPCQPSTMVHATVDITLCRVDADGLLLMLQFVPLPSMFSVTPHCCCCCCCCCYRRGQGAGVVAIEHYQGFQRPDASGARDRGKSIAPRRYSALQTFLKPVGTAIRFDVRLSFRFLVRLLLVCDE